MPSGEEPRHYLVLRHVEVEPLGLIETAIERRGATFAYVDIWDDDPVPEDLGRAHGLIVLGGPMSAYEAAAYPFLRQETRLIAAAVQDGRPVLGICLGAQLLAGALGAAVYPGRSGQEIGWDEIDRTASTDHDPLFDGAPSPLRVMHWHGDTFDLPPGAELLWTGRRYRHQAFRLGAKAYGLQFHLELTPELIEIWLSAAPILELARHGVDVAAIRRETPAACEGLAPVAVDVFQRWLDL